jgi:VanZ family protein
VWYKRPDIEGGILEEDLIHSKTITVRGHDTDQGRPIVERKLPDELHEPVKVSGFRHVFFYGGPVLAYAALIFVLSSVSRFPDAVPSFFGFDKIAHFIEYLFFGCLLYRWFSSTDQCRKRRCALLMTILIGTAYALSDEWHQSFVPGREASLWDALFDAAGVGTGAATYPLILQFIFLGKVQSGKKGEV